MRIGIIGAGGVGAYYAGLLAHGGHDVALLARGESLAVIRERGLEVRTPEGSFTTRVEVGPGAAVLGGAEVVVVAVKGYSLDSVVLAARAAAEGGAAILPLLNGVEASHRLAEQGVPVGAILGGVTYISAVRVAPGVVERRSSFQRVLVGELPAGTSPRAEAIAGAFRSAGVDAEASPDVRLELWRKLTFLAPLSAACGLVHGDIGSVRARPLGGELVARLVAETAAVARARGAALPADEEARVRAQIAALPGPLKPSFLLDLLAGGPNELEILSGAVSRLGADAGVATPVHDVAVTVLSAR